MLSSNSMDTVGWARENGNKKRNYYNTRQSSKSDYSSQSQRPKALKSSNKPILLQPFGHQVSGRASILCYDKTTLLKSFVQREVYFYRTMPKDLRSLTSEFRGVISVNFTEEVSSGILLAYALPGTLLYPNSHQVSTLSEEPKPHSKRCVKDYGQSHVIYPSPNTDPSNPYFDQHNALPTDPDDDETLSELSINFEKNVTIDDRGMEKSGLCNPWNAKMLDEAWSKLKEKPLDLSEGKVKQFVMLENVASKYVRPCVLDLKLGTRVRENASPEKLARHATAIHVGARVSGMQIFHPDRQEFVYHNKYFGHQLSVEGFHTSLKHFFSRGKIPLSSDGEDSWEQLDTNLIKRTVTKLRKLRNAIMGVTSHRFYSSSVLLLYEGATSSNNENTDSSNDNNDHCTTTNNKKTDMWHGITLGEYIHKLKQHSNKQSNAKSKSWHGVDFQNPSPKNKSPNVAIPMRKRHQSEPSIRSNKVEVDVRMIDFAHFCFHDDKIHPGPDPGFIFGLDNLIKILNLFIDKKRGKKEIIASV